MSALNMFSKAAQARGSNTHAVFELTPALVRLAMEIHADVRDKAGLQPQWETQSESMRAHYLRMAAALDDRREGFFAC